ncbi:MAG TPA: NAD(P)/FAD-dependent oxidoreductase, partial [Gemmatimonadaceae bacterium]
MIAKSATALACQQLAYAVRIDGAPVPARAVIIATGAEYRKPPLANLSQFEGAGVYYAATPMEAQLCVGEEVVVIGGGNSAGQAAVFLARSVKRVHMLVRAGGLADTMSRYLLRRIEANPAILLHTRTELLAVEGGGHLERVRWRDNSNDGVETHDVRHVFIVAGAIPNTGWLERCV